MGKVSSEVPEATSLDHEIAGKFYEQVPSWKFQEEKARSKCSDDLTIASDNAAIQDKVRCCLKLAAKREDVQDAALFKAR
ncbi:hypothetical protein E4U21_005974 [Claviceps maximensis]|nr:hypothetical protein E4U21_005974 [Claviceps maximensis]